MKKLLLNLKIFFTNIYRAIMSFLFVNLIISAWKVSFGASNLNDADVMCYDTVPITEITCYEAGPPINRTELSVFFIFVPIVILVIAIIGFIVRKKRKKKKDDANKEQEPIKEINIDDK